MSERYVCIHGHFYQPPRENPWLEAIELQDSAYPYHDWNERIAAECYAPNAASRRLDEDGKIIDIVNNYANISFNFGPTLLSWMETNSPDAYEAVLEADRKSQERFSGHGSALAQAYNHMIMPLTNRRDKDTQVLWGIRDFQHRFGRQPEGMWLPETAVDLATLEVLAEMGIQFTILASHQATRVRQVGKQDWEALEGGPIDTTMPYKHHLPSGRTIDLFFYNAEIARPVTLERLLTSGESLAHRLMEAFPQDPNRSPIVHIANDGEVYGHHKGEGDIALAYALYHMESHGLARITNYGEYLELNPPTYEVEIAGNTSWSCDHGIERWRGNCGCNSGDHPRWNQNWRGPLRLALDWLRDAMIPDYEASGRALFKDPWSARDAYIGVILDRSEDSVDAFLNEHALRRLDDDEKTTALKLLELQRHAMLMYTSCGWFFDELSGIETVQILQYAGRALQLAQEIFGDSIESHFLDLIADAKSNIPAHQDGRWIYENFVKPAMVDLPKVAAHYAVSSLFEEYTEHSNIYSYTVDLEDYQVFESGRAKLALGRARVTHQFIREGATLTFGVLHLGDHNLNADVREYQGEEAYQAMVQELSETFARAEFPEMIRVMDQHFGDSIYSLRSLFKDQQRKVLNQILESTLTGVEAVYRQQYETSHPLVRFLIDLGNPIPKGLYAAAEFIVNTDLRISLDQSELDLERIKGLLDEAKACDLHLDNEGLELLFQRTLEQNMECLAHTAWDRVRLQELVRAVELARSAPFEVDLWKVQNLYFDMLHGIYPGFKNRAEQGDREAQEWVGEFADLGQQLSVKVA